ncbi:GPR1/FUN34/YaaH family transporter [Streptomyces apocyni]|uniref:GPR1/FUN34/YaaH family transporter n=1 Tax=Streptomyces apocyni TaxID=2654677 RepID=UPI0012EAAB18|nr:GPR1/FUN34/YaaH family transporter [Streptomyces apocyni]
MDKDVSAGSTTTTFGTLALGLTLLAFGLGHTAVIDGVAAADVVPIATFVGGIALSVAGLFAFRDRDAFTGTAFASLAALWFTWGVTTEAGMAKNAAGLLLVLFALVALTLMLGASGSGTLSQGTFGLLFVSLVLLAIAQFGESAGLAKVGGWFAVVAGAVAWYAATAPLAKWPTVLPKRAAHRGVTATG